jgi:hypothetical protein
MPANSVVEDGLVGSATLLKQRGVLGRLDVLPFLLLYGCFLSMSVGLVKDDIHDLKFFSLVALPLSLAVHLVSLVHTYAPWS